MKLYYAPGACSLAPHIVARETGVAPQLVKVDIPNKKTENGDDFWAINPKGYVPALQLDGGAVLTEGPAIVQYLADQHPEKKLAPANGTLARYQLQSWLTFVGTELHKQFSPLFNPATPADFKPIVIDRLQGRFAMLDRELSTKPYLTGDAFCVADAYLFVVSSWAPRVKVDLSGYPSLLAFVERMKARPAVQEALKAEGLLG